MIYSDCHNAPVYTNPDWNGVSGRAYICNECNKPCRWHEAVQEQPDSQAGDNILDCSDFSYEQTQRILAYAERLATKQAIELANDVIGNDPLAITELAVESRDIDYFETRRNLRREQRQRLATLSATLTKEEQ